MTIAGQSQHVTEEWLSHTAEETLQFGRKLGEKLIGGEILLLSGPLGAGKTIFVKGIAGALDLDSEEVTSPSFALVNLYEGRLRLYHIDLYRLEEGPATNRVDLEELLTDEHAVIVIEWAERLGAYRFPGEPSRIRIEGAGDEERRITVSK